MKKLFVITVISHLLFLANHQVSLAQDDLDSLLNEVEASTVDTTKNLVSSAYKSTHIINLSSTKMKDRGALEFRIAHRFGTLNGGANELFGLDQATMRIGFDYGIKDWLNIGLGRSTYEKTYDFQAKVKILHQQKGKHNIPLSLLYYTNMTINGSKWIKPEQKNLFSSKISYTHQLILGSKISKSISLLIAPTLIHRNLVATTENSNTRYAIGAGGRLKSVDGWQSLVNMCLEFQQVHLPLILTTTPIHFR